MKRHGIDVVLMDLQVAPRVLDRPSYPAMEKLIADAADDEQIGLFRRFALMHYWDASHASGASPMVGPDGLHMTDAGYRCLAADLGFAALEANWRTGGETRASRAKPTRTRLRGCGRDPAGYDEFHARAPAVPMRRNDAKPFN